MYERCIWLNEFCCYSHQWNRIHSLVRNMRLKVMSLYFFHKVFTNEINPSFNLTKHHWITKNWIHYWNIHIPIAMRFCEAIEMLWLTYHLWNYLTLITFTNFIFILFILFISFTHNHIWIISPLELIIKLNYCFILKTEFIL